MVKLRSNLIRYILSFQWNHETYVLGYVQTNSIHLLHHILIAGDTHGLQITIMDMYEAKVHVLIYNHIRF